MTPIKQKSGSSAAAHCRPPGSPLALKPPAWFEVVCLIPPVCVAPAQVFWSVSELVASLVSGLPGSASQMCVGRGSQASGGVLQPQGHLPHGPFEGALTPRSQPPHQHPHPMNPYTSIDPETPAAVAAGWPAPCLQGKKCVLEVVTVWFISIPPKVIKQHIFILFPYSNRIGFLCFPAAWWRLGHLMFFIECMQAVLLLRIN